MKQKAVVILSGGIDSSTLLYAMMKDYECRALTFNYGQRHARELTAASKIADAAKVVDWSVVNISDVGLLLKGSSQTDDEVDVPDGHYTEETMRLTVVPNRNMIMLSVAAAWAISTGSTVIGFGAHHGDHAIYPDCRAPFVDKLNEALWSGNFWGEGPSSKSVMPPMVIAPFMYLSKANIVAIGRSLGVPFALTWSCYKGGAVHCGACGTCVERREAFEIAGVNDPTEWLVVPQEVVE